MSRNKYGGRDQFAGSGGGGGGGGGATENWAATLAAGASSGGTGPILSSGDTLTLAGGHNVEALDLVSSSTSNYVIDITADSLETGGAFRASSSSDSVASRSMARFECTSSLSTGTIVLDISHLNADFTVLQSGRGLWDVDNLYSSNSSVVNYDFKVGHSPTASHAGNIIGFSTTASLDSGFNLTSPSGGLSGVFTAVENTSTGTITQANGVFSAMVNSSTGIITDASLFLGEVDVTAGSITNANGLHLKDDILGAATNHFVLKLEPDWLAATNTAIVTQLNGVTRYINTTTTPGASDSPLSEVLAEGNTTGGNNIILTGGDDIRTASGHTNSAILIASEITTSDVMAISTSTITSGSIATFISTATNTVNRTLVEIDNGSAAATGTVNLDLVQGSPNSLALLLTGGRYTQLNASTTSDAFTLTANDLTAGHAATISSSSADVTPRSILLLEQLNAAATGTTVLSISHANDSSVAFESTKGTWEIDNLYVDNSGLGVYSFNVDHAPTASHGGSVIGFESEVSLETNFNLTSTDGGLNSFLGIIDSTGTMTVTNAVVYRAAVVNTAGTMTQGTLFQGEFEVVGGTLADAVGLSLRDDVLGSATNHFALNLEPDWLAATNTSIVCQLNGITRYINTTTSAGASDSDLAEVLVAGNTTGANGIEISASQALTLAASHTATAIFFESAATTSTVFDINADLLSTGGIAELTSSSPDTGIRQLLFVRNSNAAATGAVTAQFEQTSTADGVCVIHTGNGIAFDVVSSATTVNATEILANNLSTGGALFVQSNSASTSPRSLGTFNNNNSSATGCIVLAIEQAANQIAMEVAASNTTTDAVDIIANSLSTGSALMVASGSADTGNRDVVNFNQSNAAATGTTTLRVNHASGSAIAFAVSNGLVSVQNTASANTGGTSNTFTLDHEPTASHGGGVISLRGEASLDTNVNLTNTISGLTGVLGLASNTGTGTITAADGIRSVVTNNAAGSIAKATCYGGTVDIAAGTVDEHIFLHAENTGTGTAGKVVFAEFDPLSNFITNNAIHILDGTTDKFIRTNQAAVASQVSMYVSTPVASDTSSGPTVFVNLLGNSTISGDLAASGWTVDNTNKRITYTGTETVVFTTTWAISIDGTGTNFTSFHKIFKNGTTNDNTLQEQRIGGAADVQNFVVKGTFSMATNDYLEIHSSRSTSGEITPETIYVTAVEV